MFLSQLIYRKPEQERILKRAERELHSGNTSDALDLLQRFLNEREDGFVWRDADSRPSSIHREVSRILGSLDADGRRLYEQRYGVDARQLLDEAVRSGDPALFAEASRRYFHTAAGFQATNRLANRALDRGRYAQAARYWKSLIDAASHRRRVTLTLIAKAVLAFQASGQQRQSENLLQRIGSDDIRIAGKTVAAAQWLSRSSRYRTASESLQEWPMPMGNAGRNGFTTGSAPYLRPLWKRPYANKPDRDVEQLFANWQTNQIRGSRPIAVANSAIVVGDMAIFRDFAGITALDLKTGRPIWTYACETSLRALAEQHRRQIARGTASASSLASQIDFKRAFAGNGNLGMLSSDGRYVFAVDSTELTRPRTVSRRTRQPAGVDYSATAKGNAWSANRLIALPIDATQNESLKPAWSVGGAMGVPGWFIRMDADRNGSLSAREFVGRASDFKRHDLNRDGVIQHTEATKSAASLNGEPALAGHFFLGPPLPVDGRLFVMTEADRELNLVALKADTGELLWSQGIGFVGMPIAVDMARFPLGCCPSFANGVVVCPTQLGVVVAVDAVNGSLLWAYYCGDQLDSRSMRRFPYGSRRSYGHTGFPTLPQIRGNRIVYMPRESNSVHCIDLFTGEQIWKTTRDNPQATDAPSVGDEYLAAVTDDLVLLVGGVRCRALGLENGQERWSARFGLPSGTGVRVGDNYLLPLQEGRVAAIDIRTGKTAGHSIVRNSAAKRRSLPSGGIDATDDWIPGNLIAAGDVILSAGGREITAFPQSRALLNLVRGRMTERPAIDDVLLASELQLTLGDLEGAKAELTAAWTKLTPGGHQNRAESLMRELLYLELQTGSDDEAGILAQLDQISRTPLDRGRFLIRQAESQLRRNDLDDLLTTVRAFASFQLDEPMPMQDETHLVSAAGWIPNILSRARTRFGDDELERLRTPIDAEQQKILASGEIDKLRQFLVLYRDWPQADAVRQAYAEKLAGNGRYQKAELLLLQNRQSRHLQIAAPATRTLVQLWDRLGLYEEAAGLLEELESKFGEVPVAEGQTGREFVRGFQKTHPSGEALRRLQPIAWKVSRVNIREERWTGNDLASWNAIDKKLENPFGRYRRRFPTPLGSSYELLDKGTRSQGRIDVIDKQAGVAVGSIRIPSRISFPAVSRNAQIGHFIPMGSETAMNGLSLLQQNDGDPLWTNVPAQLAKRSEILRVGPSGPGFCTFQGRGHLMVADPSDGTIIWHRTDLEPNAGLLGDSYAGLIGDDKVLVLFGSDRASYTVYRTATGEELRRGRLEINTRQIRRVFGRRLFFVGGSQTEPRLQIWDPLDDRILFDEPGSGRTYTAVTPDGELVIVLPSNRVIVLDVSAGRKSLDWHFEASERENLNYLRAFKIGGSYYVNFQRAVNQSRTRYYSYYSSDTFLPVIHAQGDLYALDAKTGKRLWKRAIPQRTIINTPFDRLPFLVTISRVSDRWNRNKQSLLVEVLDAQTGHVIGRKDNNLPDRLVQFVRDPRTNRIELRGLKTKITIDFGPEHQRFLLDERPL